MALSRRHFLLGSSSALMLSACSSPLLTVDSAPGYDYVLTAQPHPIELIPGTTTPAWCFNQAYPMEPLRAKQGQPVRILFRNRLAEPTTIHWHGLRIPIQMDGVPFLSQPPVAPGSDFLYEFTPPDAGTFWFHPHVNSLQQLGRGLVGALIVEEADAVAFDQDITLLLKNWHLTEDGEFAPFTSPRNAARMGTPGNWETVNGAVKPTIEVPCGARVRLRFLNVDNTVMYTLAAAGVNATVIAIDGNPVAKPFLLEPHKIGPGMRLDVAINTPKEAGKTVKIRNGKGKLFFDLVSFVTAGQPNPNPTLTIPTLPLNPIKEVNLSKAEELNFVFEWEGAITPAAKNGKTQHQFWTINRRAWQGMSAQSIPEPVANLKLGGHYVFNLRNVTPHAHPIHLHGYTWKVLESNKREITPYHTDTVLLEKNERVKVAFVADNPGRWMYHCHVIEHMKTGLMGYIRVA